MRTYSVYDRDYVVKFENLGRTCIFIDGANMHETVKALRFMMDFDKFRDFWKYNIPGLIRLNYYIAIPDTNQYSKIIPLTDRLSYTGYNVVGRLKKEYFDEDGNRRHKGDVDIDIAVDMMEMAERLDTIILCTGDSDFTKVIESVQRKGVRVIILSTRATAYDNNPIVSSALVKQADIFIDMAEIYGNFINE